MNAIHIPRTHSTPDGYEYFRCRAAGDDSTIYVHQLVSLLNHDPREVFDENTHIHHRNSIPWDNRPSNLEPIDAEEHSLAHLAGEEPGRREIA